MFREENGQSQSCQPPSTSLVLLPEIRFFLILNQDLQWPNLPHFHRTQEWSPGPGLAPREAPPCYCLDHRRHLPLGESVSRELERLCPRLQRAAGERGELYSIFVVVIKLLYACLEKEALVSLAAIGEVMPLPA